MGAVLGGILVGLFLGYVEYNPYVTVVEAKEEVVTPKEVRIEVMIDWSKERIEKEIEKVSEKYNVSYEEMKNTVACESGYNPNIQSHHVRNGVREESYGVAQFYLPARNRTADGRVITKEIALDPAQALDAMAFHFSQGNKKAWTCWRTQYGV